MPAVAASHLKKDATAQAMLEVCRGGENHLRFGASALPKRDFQVLEHRARAQ